MKNSKVGNPFRILTKVCVCFWFARVRVVQDGNGIYRNASFLRPGRREEAPVAAHFDDGRSGFKAFTAAEPSNPNVGSIKNPYDAWMAAADAPTDCRCFKDPALRDGRTEFNARIAASDGCDAPALALPRLRPTRGAELESSPHSVWRCRPRSDSPRCNELRTDSSALNGRGLPNAEGASLRGDGSPECKMNGADGTDDVEECTLGPAARGLDGGNRSLPPPPPPRGGFVCRGGTDPAGAVPPPARAAITAARPLPLGRRVRLRDGGRRYGGVAPTPAAPAPAPAPAPVGDGSMPAAVRDATARGAGPSPSGPCSTSTRDGFSNSLTWMPSARRTYSSPRFPIAVLL